MSNRAVALDAADKRLLRIVQQDCALPAEEIGARCGMSASTVLRRLRKLRAAGVIRQEAAILDPKKIGRPLHLIVGVKLVQEDGPAVAAFLARMRADPIVTQCYFVTGSADYIIHISARDMDDYNDFVQELVSDPHIGMSETSVVITPVKVSLAMPIDD